MEQNFFEEKNNKQKYLIFIFIAIILVILFTLRGKIFKNFSADIVPSFSAEYAAKIQDVEINFNFLDSPMVGDLILSENFSYLPQAKNISLTPVLSWNPVSGAENYLWEIIGFDSGQTKETSVDLSKLGKTLQNSKTYAWRVRACNQDMSQCGSWSGDCKTGGELGCGRFFTIASPALNLLSPADKAKDVLNNPVLSWNPVSGAENYLWEIIGFDSGQTKETSVDLSKLGKTLQNSKTYAWRVRACNQDMSQCGLFSSSREFTTANLFAKPEILNPGFEKIIIGRDNPFLAY